MYFKNITNTPFYRIYNKLKQLVNIPYYNENIGYPYRGYEAIKYLVDNFEFDSVLDVGSGEGIHSNIFLKAGKNVTAIDYGESYYFKKQKVVDNKRFKCIIADINKFETEKKYDVVWCSHVLEHQLNPHNFLTKVLDLCEDGGILAITVPPYKCFIVGGHVSLWNAGLLLYHLVLAGCDCSEACVKTYDYDVSVIVKKKQIDVMADITYDMGDIKKIKKFLPPIKFYETKNDITFDGNIREINW